MKWKIFRGVGCRGWELVARIGIGVRSLFSLTGSHHDLTMILPYPVFFNRVWHSTGQMICANCSRFKNGIV